MAVAALAASLGFAVVYTSARTTFASVEGCDLFPRVLIEGRVLGRRGETAAPLANARLSVDEYDFWAETDSDGRFAGDLMDIPHDAIITIRATHPQFKRDSLTMRISQPRVRMPDMRLDLP